MLITTRRLTVFAVAALFALTALVAPPGGIPEAQAQLFGISEQQEIQIGHEVERQFAAKYGFVQDAAQNERVQSIGLRLARVSERPKLPWTYHIVRDPSVNAVAAPGGFIFVTSGLLRFVQSDNELAFVIGHETTHVAHRHAVDLAQKDMELQFGAVLVSQIFFGGSYASYALAQIGRSLMDAKYSRDKEFEADHYGVIFAQKAGFDPTASLAFFERLQQTEKAQPGAMAHAFEDHPDTPARIAAVRTELRQMGYQVAGAPPAASTPTPPPATQPAGQPASPAPVPPSHRGWSKGD